MYFIVHAAFVLIKLMMMMMITLDSHANASAFHWVSIMHERGLVTFSAIFNEILLIMRNAFIEIVIFIYTVSQIIEHPNTLPM